MPLRLSSAARDASLPAMYAMAKAVRVACLCLASAPVGIAGIAPARAQAIALSVNGDPVTNVDLEQRMKLLRAYHKAGTREAAVESMIEDRLKAHEASRFGIAIKDEEIGEQVQSDAKKLKISGQQLLADIAKTGVSQDHARGHFKAELAYSVLVRALNRGVEASEIQVRQEMAKEKGKSTIISYTIRQVVFTVNPGGGVAALSASVKDAEALRGKFTSCETGIPYAKSLPGVAVREKLTRTSAQLGDGIKEVLDKTPLGHLTAPSRSPNGIELIAVCERSAAKDDDELRKTIAERLLAEHMEQDVQAKYKEMRSHAVIERR